MRKIRIYASDWIWIALPVLMLSILLIFAGFSTGLTPAPADDIDEINEVLDNFEDAYSNEQLNDLRLLFFAEAVIAMDGEQGTRQYVYGLEDWLAGTQEQTFALNEYISDSLTDREINVYRNIAYVVCDYTFIDDDEIGQGVDIFTLVKMRDRWRIVSLQFTGDEALREQG